LKDQTNLRSIAPITAELRADSELECLIHQTDRAIAVKITSITVHDVRFPTSHSLDGSDAMHRSPDYSAAYVVLRTDDEALSGHGLTFTNGRGTEVCVAAIRALTPLVVGRTLEGITGDMRTFWRSIVSDDQLRWLGPEKGVMHLAAAAVVNAVWDLWA
jgi:L-fuconate dehydratase